MIILRPLFLILLFYSISFSISVSAAEPDDDPNTNPAQAAHTDDGELLQLSVLLEVMAEGLINED